MCQLDIFTLSIYEAFLFFLLSYSVLTAQGPQPCVNNHTKGLRGALTALQKKARCKGRWGRHRL